MSPSRRSMRSGSIQTPGRPTTRMSTFRSLVISRSRCRVPSFRSRNIRRPSWKEVRRRPAGWQGGRRPRNGRALADESVYGERGIRTLDTGLTPYNGLANRRLQPLGHLSPIRWVILAWRLGLTSGYLAETGKRGRLPIPPPSPFTKDTDFSTTSKAARGWPNLAALDL